MQQYLRQIWDNKIIRALIITFAIITALLPIFLSIFRYWVECDASYYLSTVERVSEGHLLYKEIAFGYMPFWIYFMAALKAILNIPSSSMAAYSIWLAIHYVFTLFTALILFKIAKEINLKRALCWFASWLFLIMSHWLHGNIVLLEIPSICFGLWGMLILLKQNNKNIYHYLLSGLLCSAAFLVKQYGIGFYGLALFLISFSQDFSLKKWMAKTLSLSLGFFVPIIICTIIWKEDFLRVIFSDYGTKSAIDAGYSYTVSSKIADYWNAVFWHMKRINPSILFSIICTPFIINKKNWVIITFLLLGFFGFAGQFIFNITLNYHLYLIPFGIIFSLYIFNFSILSKKRKCLINYISILCLILTTILSLYSTYRNRVYKLYIKSNIRTEQIATCQEIKKIIGEINYNEANGTLWIPHAGLMYVYYLLNASPPNLDTIGYSFGPLGIDLSKAKKQIECADYVVYFSEDYTDFEKTYFTDNIKDFVQTYPTTMIKNNTIYLSKISSPK